MSRNLIAALLLLLVGGSGAAFSIYVMASTGVEPAPVATEVPVVPELAAEQVLVEPTPASTPTQVPTAEPEATATPTPVLPEQTPTPTPVSEPEADPVAEIQEWPVAQPERWAPTGIAIPDIGVDAPVIGVGLTDTGEMEAPAGYDDVGWFRLGAKPGDPGRAVLAGHVDSRGGPAVFYRLGELRPGTVIDVTAGSGDETLHYVVRETARYPENDAPLERIFGPADESELVLITCAGDFDFEAGMYPDRLVVFADLVPESQ